MKPANNKNLSKILSVVFVLSIVAMACQVSIPETSFEVNPPQINVPTFEAPEIVIPTIIAPELPEISIPAISGDEQSLLVELYKRINPSVVNITIYQSEQENLIPLGQGSGFLYDSDGNIITNAHVVHGADEIEVAFSNGLIRPAILKGEDLNSDLAVVQVENLPEGLVPLTLGNMEQVEVGQTVLAIGNPFGLDGTLTRGIVSAIGRTIPALTPFSIPQAIQTDAPINPGNSGGPLLNLQGEVIGVNAQIETDGQNRVNSGIGFAIPVSIVSRVVPELIKDGTFEWAWLGVRGSNLNYSLAQALNLPVEQGAYISEILVNGPAAKAGLQGASGSQNIDGRTFPVGGDVIVAINGNPVKSFDDLLIFIALQANPGDEVTLTVLRNGETLEVPLKLEPRPSSFE